MGGVLSVYEDVLGFGLYVHWPFCVSKCPYCDFNSHVSSKIDHDHWKWALLQALDYEAARSSDRILTSVFFGGGTPSLMQPSTVAALLDRATLYWSLADNIEVTLEANPCTIDRSLCVDFRTAGINRLSLGIQALDDTVLRWLGRTHDTDQAIVAVDLAQRFFSNLSFDLVYARPHQTLEAWRLELEQAIILAGDHLSLYQLTVEPCTPFFIASASGALVLPDDDTSADLYQLTQEVTNAAGLPAYEISNHARPGSESRHNLTCWHGGDIIGIGPGAHGRITNSTGTTLATYHHRAPKTWLEELKSADHCTISRLSPRERIEELLLTGLRLVNGIDRGLFHRLTGSSLEEVLSPRSLRYLKEFVILDEVGLRTTPAGWLILNEILFQLTIQY